MGFTGGVSGGQDAVTTNYTGDRGMSLLVQDESYRHGSFLELVVIINIPKYYYVVIITSASKSCIRGFVITEKAPTRAFSWLKAATTAFTFKILLRHYAKRALTPRSLNVKLGPRRKGHKGRAVWLA